MNGPSTDPVTGESSTSHLNGVATFSDLSVSAAGSYSLIASDGALAAPKPAKFTVTPDVSGSRLVLVQQPASTIVGMTLSPPIVVKVEDEFGNVITTDHSKATLSIVSGPGGTLGGTTTVKASNGIATFSKATLSMAGPPTYVLAVTDASLATTTPVQFTQTIAQGVTTVVAPHPSASYTFGKTISLSATFKSSASKSVPFTGTASILDQNGQMLGSATGTATVDANGSVKFSLTGVAVGTYVCTLFYPGDVNHTAITSSSFTLLVKP